MEQLSLDFNRLDAQRRVRIGPVAFARNVPLRLHLVDPGDQVLVVDDDGNRCVGVLMEDPTAPEGHRLVVQLDWSTWRDGEGGAALHYSAVAQ
jgi:hypothetical protein